MKKKVKYIRDKFQQLCSSDPVWVRSPGRVNLIGDHTDYNNGFVLPSAIDRSIVAAIAPNFNQKIRAYAVDMDQNYFEADISGDIKPVSLRWANYLLGVVSLMRKSDYNTGGFDCVFGGDIPIGAGLSSSAALEGAIIYGLNEIYGLGLSRIEMARLGQQVEHQFVGVNCGIMDQFTNLFGRENELIKLDCRSLEFERIPFPNREVRILLCDTKVHRELVSSEYNKRREQCNEAVKYFQQFDPEIDSLRDLSSELLEKHKSKLDRVIYNRSRFIIDENNRVEATCNDLLRDDIEAFGERMYESHRGLRDLYEVSCRELDILVEKTGDMAGVLGARMMGGGFGGCTINLVKKEEAESIRDQLFEFYITETDIKPDIYVVNTSAGTCRYSVNHEVGHE
jgi:galactokinase